MSGKCWNCKEGFHKYGKCPKPSGYFCRKCSLQDCGDSKSCPRCNGHGWRSLGIVPDAVEVSESEEERGVTEEDYDIYEDEENRNRRSDRMGLENFYFIFF